MKKTSRSSENRAPGFTLMELLVALSIVVVLAALTVGYFSFANQKQAVEGARLQLGLLESGIEAYRSEMGRYPIKEGSDAVFTGVRASADLQYELCPPPGAEEQGRVKKVFVPELDPESDRFGWLSGSDPGQIEILDPWGVPYIYRTNDPSSSRTRTINPGFDLWSSGPDGETAFSGSSYDPTHPKNLDDIRLW